MKRRHARRGRYALAVVVLTGTAVNVALYRRSRRLTPLICAHAAWNLVTYLVILANMTASAGVVQVLVVGVSSLAIRTPAASRAVPSPTSGG